VSINRPGLLPTRAGTPNQNPSYPNIGSPSLSHKSSAGDHIPLSAKTSPAANSYTPSVITQRVPSSVPTTDSPSIPTRGLNNPSSYYATNQQSIGIKTDSNSLRSEDSTTSSEEPLHQISLQPVSSLRNQDVSSPNLKHRPPHGHPSQANTNNLITHLTNTTSSSTGTTISSTTGGQIERVPSPSPSLISEREREENDRVERELEFKRKRLQIYVFICRCIACPFNAKQSSDMARKHLKVNLVQYGVIKERFLAFLNGKTHIEVDEGKR